jgi:hypothetical protein
MAVEIWADETAYFLRQSGGSAALRWSQDGGTWGAERGQIPPGAARTELDRVPADLREELLAFMARATSVGDIWQGLE